MCYIVYRNATEVGSAHFLFCPKKVLAGPNQLAAEAPKNLVLGWDGMKIRQLEEELVKLIEPVITFEGLELWELTFRREAQGWILKVLMEKAGGVTHEDCELISRQISDLLDVEDLIDRPYRLEVSSPGLDRPLLKESHFQRFIGQEAKITTKSAWEGQRRFTGKILAVQDHKILLEDRTRGRVEIPLEDIEKANLLPDLKW